MRKLFLSLPLLLTMTFVASCSKDIKVTSDLGEVSVVKESAVTTYPFDEVNADKFSRKWIDEWTDYKTECYQSKYLDNPYCDRNYDKYILDHEGDTELISQMPIITIVKYRTINTNVNGDKTASGYKYVSCIPEGEAKDRVKWAELINDIDGVNADPKKEIANNLLNDGLVTSSVQREVCEKYGNL